MKDEKFEVPLYTEQEKISDFEMYIYGTKNAEEKKYDSFGKALKRYANEIGITSSKIAELIGVSKSIINYYFIRERQVGFNTLIAL